VAFRERDRRRIMGSWSAAGARTERSRPDAPSVERSGEAGRADPGKERSGSEHSCLRERVVTRENAKEALKRLRRNKGSPGVDGMRVDELERYLHENWQAIHEQLLAGTWRPSAAKRQLIDERRRYAGARHIRPRFRACESRRPCRSPSSASPKLRCRAPSTAPGSTDHRVREPAGVNPSSSLPHCCEAVASG
jgi:hypothetical protein